MRPKEVPACPFCDYTHNSHYFLLQHVETVHPEGTSPFVVTENAGHHTTGSGRGEAARESSPEYIECQCGEFCILAEFESHLDMHYAEGAGFDEMRTTSPDLAEREPNRRQSKAFPMPTKRSAPLALDPVISAPSGGNSATRYLSRKDNEKRHNPVLGFIDAIRHPSAPPPRKGVQRIRSTNPQRLGVGEDAW